MRDGIGDWRLASLDCGLDQGGYTVLEQFPDSAGGLAQLFLLAPRQQKSQLLLLQPLLEGLLATHCPHYLIGQSPEKGLRTHPPPNGIAGDVGVER